MMKYSRLRRLIIRKQSKQDKNMQKKREISSFLLQHLTCLMIVTSVSKIIMLSI